MLSVARRADGGSGVETICICHPASCHTAATLLRSDREPFPRKNCAAAWLHLHFFAEAEISVCIGVSGRIKGRACGFEVGGARGSEDRLLLRVTPMAKATLLRQVRISAQVSCLKVWCNWCMHQVAQCQLHQEEATPGPAARNVSRSTLQREAREAQGMIVWR